MRVQHPSPLRLLGLFAAGLFSAATQVLAAPPAFAPGQLIVKPKPGVTRERAESIYHEHGAELETEIAAIGVHVLRIAPQALASAEKAFGNRPEFEIVERNRIFSAALSPNDPSYWKEWHLTRIHAPQAWDVTTGASIKIAILDTGVDASHPDLAGQVLAGFNTYDHTTDTSDPFGHGTSVAGVAAAASNNALGVASVAWQSALLPIRIVDSQGYAYASTIAEGLTWAIDHGARVANVSFADIENDPAIRSAAQYVTDRGGLVVAAAGNCACDDPSAESPYILSVSATGPDDALTSFSSRGAYVDLAAPGIGIQTTVSGSDYASASGTSFASPIVAGVAALMLAAHPSRAPWDVESMLEGTAQDLGAAGYDPSFGFGLVDAAAAVTAASENAPPPADVTPPSASITSPSDGASVSGAIQVTATAIDDRGMARVELYVDGVLVGTDASAPYAFAWDTSAAAPGSHSLRAVAYDAAGNAGASAPVTVSSAGDVTAPTVRITSPATGSTATKTTKITLDAADDRALAALEAFVDGVSLGSLSCSGATCSGTFTWRPQRASRGSHSVTAVARDAAGNVGQAAPITLSVR